MKAIAADFVQEFGKLPSAEQQRLRDEVTALTKARQREAVKRFRGSSEGEGLLALLLEDRRKERARD